MSFDEIFDLTAGVYSNFYTIYIYVDVRFEPTIQISMVYRRRYLLRYQWNISLFDISQKKTKLLPKLSHVTIDEYRNEINGRLRGMAPARRIGGACATMTLNLLEWESGRLCFVGFR